jgi:hypothetical protein
VDTDALACLESWYLAQCNGDWEHEHGIEISNIDNPGWRIRVDLAGTSLAGRVQERIRLDRTEQDWVQYWSDGVTFEAACGPGNLREAVRIFCTFSISSTRKGQSDVAADRPDSP